MVIAPTGFSVVHVPAGPAIALPKDALLRYMPAFGDWVASAWRAAPPDVVHAHFWMSGVAAIRATRTVGTPVVLTYHGLGTVKRRFQGGADTSPLGRIIAEQRLGHCVDRVVAQCPDEILELEALGIPREVMKLIPSGVDIHRFSPLGRAAPRRRGMSRHPHRRAAGRTEGLRRPRPRDRRPSPYRVSYRGRRARRDQVGPRGAPAPRARHGPGPNSRWRRERPAGSPP